MSRSSEGSSSGHSRENMITLPPIRDIFRDQLSSPSPQFSPRPPRSSYISGTVHLPYASESRPHTSASSRTPSSSPDMRYSRGEVSWSSASSQRNAAPTLRPSHSYGAAFPEVSPRRHMPEQARTYGSSPASAGARTLPTHSRSGYAPSSEPSRYLSTPSGPNTIGDSSRLSAPGNAVWTEHRRRDSAESAWSSHSSSSGASSHLHSMPPPSNALQFQPLPHSQMATSYPHAHSSAHNSANPNQPDYQSPFGVLIADIDPRAASSSDPQRTALFRSLRTSGAQGTFQINFDDPTNSQNPPRYSCQYCGKGFARPSSLRIHNNSHTGEKPFQCPHPDCGRRFSVHSNMRRHCRVHGGDAPKNGESSGDEVADE